MVDCGNISTAIPNALRYFYNINFTVCTGVNVFGLYMLITQTPKEMKQYKYVLMNIAFWAYSVDFCGNLLIGPVNFLPLFGGTGIGSLRWIFPGDGFIQVLLILIATTGCINSIVFGFMYRWWILCIGHWVHDAPWRLPAIAAAPFIVFCPTIAYFHYTMWPTRLETAAYLGKVCPHLVSPMMEFDVLLMLDESNPPVQHLMTVFNLSGVFNVACLVYALIRIFHKMNERNAIAMSEKTINMNRQLTWSLILHTALPGLSYIGPTAIAMAAMQMHVADVQNFLHFMGAIFLTHSTWSALAMVVTIAPYRRKLLEWLRIAGNSKTTVTSTQRRLTTVSTINV